MGFEKTFFHSPTRIVAGAGLLFRRLHDAWFYFLTRTVVVFNRKL